ncbi:MAG: hypothetical protein FWD99_08870 [Oscillospiraceae bacterium]|nr:hypothetical protein [Oscillospiraceae bacterium]
MDKSRVKTFILFLLLAANLAFLGILLTDRVHTVRIDQGAKVALVQVLENMGFSMDVAAIPDTRDQAFYRLIRDIAAEVRVADSVLGNAARTEAGGGIYHYTSSQGYAQFRAGSFRFQLNTPADAQTMFDYLQLTAREPIWAADVLVYPLTIEDMLVFNGQVVFYYPDGQLREISGPALWGTRRRYASGPLQDVTTALIQLADHLRERGTVSRFEYMEMGYYLAEGIGYLELRPVWIVTTDGGAFSIDRQSGVVR